MDNLTRALAQYLPTNLNKVRGNQKAINTQFSSPNEAIKAKIFQTLQGMPVTGIGLEGRGNMSDNIDVRGGFNTVKTPYGRNTGYNVGAGYSPNENHRFELNIKQPPGREKLDAMLNYKYNF